MLNEIQTCYWQVRYAIKRQNMRLAPTCCLSVNLLLTSNACLLFVCSATKINAILLLLSLATCNNAIVVEAIGTFLTTI
jgi:hypothetical protein